jgi:hypothetical protein
VELNDGSVALQAPSLNAGGPFADARLVDEDN